MRSYILIFLLIIPVTGLSSAGSVCIKDHNIIPNPSFEAGKAQPGYWSKKTREGGKIARFKWDRHIRHSGNRSVMIYSSPSYATCWGAWTTRIQLTGGIKWCFSGWTRARQITNGGFGGWIWCGGRPIGSFMGVNGSSDWVKNEGVVDIPEDTKSVILGLEFRRACGRVWVDDLLAVPYFLKLIADMQTKAGNLRTKSLPSDLYSELKKWQAKLDALRKNAVRWRGKSAGTLKQYESDAFQLQSSLRNLQDRIFLAQLSEPILIRFYRPLISIYQRPSELPAEQFNDAVRIYALRGETESFQVTCLATGNDADEITIELKLPNKFIAKIYKVDYVKYQTNRHLHNDLWPDVLIPANNITLLKGKVQPIWIDIKIPTDNICGTFNGKIFIKKNQQLLCVKPVYIYVANYTIARPTRMKAVMTIIPNYRVYNKEKGKIEQIALQRIRILAEHHIRPLLKFQKVDFMLKAFKMLRERYHFRWMGTEGMNADDWRTVYNTAVQQRWVDGLFYNVWDEPPGCKAVKKYADFKRSYPQAQTLLTLSEYRTAIRPYAKVVDVWCPDPANYSRDPKFHNSRRHRWWYFCSSGAITNPIKWRRFAGIDAWKCHRDGFLYWCAIASSSNYVYRNGQWSITGTHTGDGGIVYPDPRAKWQLFTSIRLKNVRDGVEDWELLNTVGKFPTLTDRTKEKDAEFIFRIRQKAFELLKELTSVRNVNNY